MSAADLRVALDPILQAFGVPAVVTRPAPDDAPVSTTVVWMPTPLNETQPYGTDFRKREPRRVMAVTRNASIPAIPRGTRIVAAEELGGAAKTWIVDGHELTEADCWRVAVTLATT